MTITRKSMRVPSASAVALILAAVGVAAGAGASSANATTTPRTPQSIECSKQADAKGLHGKPREAFRADCKRHAKTTQAMPMPAPVKAPSGGAY